MPVDSRYRLVFGCARFPGWRGELLLLLGLALAACVLTWPIAATLASPSGLRGDYFNNLWNAWWVQDSILHGHSPYWTDKLYFPEGISLARHTLSPLNSLTLAALGSVLSAHAAFNVLLLAHFALSAWCFSLLARYVSGSTAGGVLAGLVYSFCPFHYFYLCQINVFSFEFLPLALLFFLRHFREGGARNLWGMALATAGMTMSAEYYVVYAYLTMGALVLCARAWAPEVSWRAGLSRSSWSLGLGALAAVVVAFPLLYATLGPEHGAESGTAAFAVEKHRTNDLFGFYWIGPKEESIVSWPTMLGYSTLTLLVLAGRRLKGIWPWLVVGLLFWVLSLGSSLVVNGRDTEFPMPYAVFEHLPVLSMLRKSDRAFLMVQVVASLALAAAWAALAPRLGRRQGVTWCACAGLVMLELTGVPFARFELPTSPYLAELAREEGVSAVMDLPPAKTHVANGRFDYLQTLHHKKTTLGYTTALAVTPFHDQRVEALVNWYWQLLFERGRTLVRKASELGVQRIVHYKTYPLGRERLWIDGRVLWTPFFFVREPLVRVRQTGEFQPLALETPFAEVVRRIVPELVPQIPADKASLPFLDVVRLELTRACGPPIHEDEQVMVFAVPESR
ncbi:MAG: hypothetical protein EXS08_05975 [Planctomycetes bacterium]|nr:hypothetical protein [Planctomycetota bacterium]